MESRREKQTRVPYLLFKVLCLFLWQDALVLLHPFPFFLPSFSRTLDHFIKFEMRAPCAG